MTYRRRGRSRDRLWDFRKQQRSCVTSPAHLNCRNTASSQTICPISCCDAILTGVRVRVKALLYCTVSGNPGCHGSFCIAWLWRPLRGRDTARDSKLCRLALTWEPSFTSPLLSCCLLATGPCGLTQADLWLAFLLPQPLSSGFIGHQVWQPAPLPTEPSLWPWSWTFLIYVWTNYTKETFKLSNIFIFKEQMGWVNATLFIVLL